MAYSANGFSVLDKSGFNVFHTTPQKSFAASDLIAPIVTLGVIAATGLTLLFKQLFSRVLVDKQGNKIPNGSWALPIVGQSESLPPVLLNGTDNPLRLIPLSNTVSRAGPRPLGQKVWKFVLNVAWQPALHDHVRFRHCQEPYDHQWWCFLVTEGTVHQESNYFCWSWHHGYAV